MPREFGQLLENDFRNGYVTQATGLNFPQGAVVDCENVNFNDDGSVSRRFGIDYEESYVLNVLPSTNAAVSEYYWSAAGGVGTNNFVVLQVGTTIYFFKAIEESSLSANVHATTINLTTYAVISGETPDVRGTPCDFTSGQGYLFITHSYCKPVRVTYDPDTDSLTSTEIRIRVRDFEGVDDNLSVIARPATLSRTHEYNLINQGWDFNADWSGGGSGNVISKYFTDLSVYPSNAEQWWYYKDVNEKFDTAQRGRRYFGNMQVPAGGEIIDPFASTRDSRPSITADTTPLEESNSSYYRPSTCAFFAGRVFYAGVNYKEFAGRIYFSQIIVDNKNFAKCYQKNDPTSEIYSDLLPTDGGVISIPDAGNIYKLYAMQKGLLVFASNGIWAISGTDATPFRADDFTVAKISSQVVHAGTSVVDALGTPIFWDDYGIWSVAVENGISFVVQGVSEAKIKGYFRTLPVDSIRTAKGVFDYNAKIVYWLYRENAPASIEQRRTFTHMLSMNLMTGAFSKHSFSQAGTSVIAGAVNAGGFLISSENIVTNSSLTTVTDTTSATVYVGAPLSTLSIRFVTFVNSVYVTFSRQYEDAYQDWTTSEENYQYSSWFKSAYQIGSEGVKEFQSNYLLVYTKDETSASAYIKGIWDWTNSTSSHKWTRAEQLYPTASNRDYKVRKIKMRGWGKALQFYVYSDTNKPFKIAGAGVFISRNPLP